MATITSTRTYTPPSAPTYYVARAFTVGLSVRNYTNGVEKQHSVNGATNPLFDLCHGSYSKKLQDQVVIT